MSTIPIASEEVHSTHLAATTKAKQLVYFTAQWCGPCQMVAADIEQMSEHFEATADILKIDLDSNPELARSYNISAVPTFILLTKPDESSTMHEVSRVTGADLVQVRKLLELD